MRATRVTIHHEGGGAPTDRVSRFLNAARYSAGIGITRYELVRAPEQSFTTVGQDGKCLQICLSGHRGRYPVTDSDLALVHTCCDEARAKDWLTLTPVLYLHGDTMSTECPGAFTEARRGDLERAVRAAIPVVTPPPGPPLTGKKELMLIEQPGRTVDPVRLACIELRPEDYQIIAWNGASVAGDALLKAGDAQRRGECRVLDVKNLAGSKNIVGWKEAAGGCVFVTDGDGGTFHIEFS